MKVDVSLWKSSITIHQVNGSRPEVICFSLYRWGGTQTIRGWEDSRWWRCRHWGCSLPGRPGLAGQNRVRRLRYKYQRCCQCGSLRWLVSYNIIWISNKYFICIFWSTSRSPFRSFSIICAHEIRFIQTIKCYVGSMFAQKLQI